MGLASPALEEFDLDSDDENESRCITGKMAERDRCVNVFGDGDCKRVKEVEMEMEMRKVNGREKEGKERGGKTGAKRKDKAGQTRPRSGSMKLVVEWIMRTGSSSSPP